MTRIRQVQERLHRADGIPAVLDAAHDAFEGMLMVIRAHEDPDYGLFVPLVMAAASAAEGRNAIIFAPSLSPRRLHPATSAAEPSSADAEATTAELADLSELLAARLADAARNTPHPEDQAACRNAARSARDIHSLLTGREP